MEVVMEAGRELDAAIAVRVMGWEMPDSRYLDGTPAPPIVYDETGRARGGPGEGWSPSTKIAQAWEVVEKMDKRGFWLRLVTPFDDGSLYHAGFTPLGVTGWNGRPDHEAAADTAPLAICKAALKAVSQTADTEGATPDA
jgi:hypothetical protein